MQVRSLCSGLREQRLLGRRPIEQLRLAVSPPRIEGTGTDVIGAFLLEGAIAQGGSVSLQTTYVGKHDVTYDGHYDGEGRMWGTWKCGPDSGRWMIAMRRGGEEADIIDDLVEIEPARRR